MSDTGLESSVRAARRAPAWFGSLHLSRARLELALPAFVIAVAVAHLARQQGLAVGPDTWLDILGGHQIVGHGLPRHDTLTVLAHGHPWVDQQWLAQLVVYGGYTLGGLGLLKLANAALLLGALTIALAVGLRRCGSAVAVSGVALLGEIVLFDRSLIRAETIAQLLYVVLLAVVFAEARRPSRRIMLLFPILLIWANVHGTVVLGAAIVAGAGLIDMRRGEVRRGAALLVGAALSTLASPYATGLPGYYGSTLGNPALQSWATEWQAPSISTAPQTYLLALLVVVFLARGWRRLLPIERLVLCLAVPLALSTIRSSPWLVYPAIMALPAALTGEASVSRYRMARPLLVICGMVAVALAGFAAIDVARGGPSTPGYAPADARAVAQQFGDGTRWHRLVATDYLADWLLLKDPATRGHVLYDARYEILSESELGRVSLFWIAAEPHFASLLRPGDLLVVDPSRKSLLRLVERCPGMKLLYTGSSLSIVGITSMVCGPQLGNLHRA